MSIVSWANKNSRAMGKVGLYVAGGLALGWPLIKGAHQLYDGVPLEEAAGTVVLQATGYNQSTGQMDKPMLRNAIIRDVVGAGAILAARKL